MDKTVVLPEGAATLERTLPELSPEFRERFELGDELGGGAMGVVFRAVDRRMGRAVAVKLLAGAASGEAYARFRREGQLLARLAHPHVVAVYDLDEVCGRPFLVTELMEGGSVAGLLKRRGRLPVEEAVALVRRCLDGLGACHDAGILHRDVKPGNVLLDGRGTPKLADLGIALFAGDAARLTETGALVGTPLYMAPELLAAAEATVASDVYAMGALLYELVSGRPPHSSGSLPLLIKRIQLEEAPDVREWNAAVPASLARTLSSCLARDPAARPASAAAFAALLDGSARRSAAAARAPSTPHPAPRNARRAVLTASLGAALLAGGLAWVTRRAPPPPPPVPARTPAVESPSFEVAGLPVCAEFRGLANRYLDVAAQFRGTHRTDVTPGGSAIRALETTDSLAGERRANFRAAEALVADLQKHGEMAHQEIERAPFLEVVLYARAELMRATTWLDGRRTDTAVRVIQDRMGAGDSPATGLEEDPVALDLLARAGRAVLTVSRRISGGEPFLGDVVQLLADFHGLEDIAQDVMWSAPLRARLDRDLDTLFAALHRLPGERAQDIAIVCAGAPGAGFSAGRRPTGGRALRDALAALERIGRRDPATGVAVRDVVARLGRALR